MNLAQEFVALLRLWPATSYSCRHEFPAIMICVLELWTNIISSFWHCFRGVFCYSQKKSNKVFTLLRGHWRAALTNHCLMTQVKWPKPSSCHRRDSQGLSQPRAWSDLNSRHLVLQIQWCVTGEHKKELRVFAFFSVGKAKLGDCRKEVFSDSEELCSQSWDKTIW